MGKFIWYVTFFVILMIGVNFCLAEQLDKNPDTISNRTDDTKITPLIMFLVEMEKQRGNHDQLMNYTGDDWISYIPEELLDWLATNQGRKGNFLRNEVLANITEINISPYSTPETILEHDGYLYASVKGGVIIKLLPDGSNITEVVNTSGCILGFDFDSEGNLYFTDSAYPGVGGAILKVNSSNNQSTPEILTRSVDEKPLTFPDAITVASDGTVYFSDACIFSPMDYGNDSDLASDRDIREHTSTGKILVYNPADRSTSVMMSGLAFANGVILDDSEKNLFVAETQEFRIWKIDIRARNLTKGETGGEVFLDNLPGYPDNLSRGKGKVWVGLVSPRYDLIDENTEYPFNLTNTEMNQVIELFIQKGYSHVFAFDEKGNIVENLQSATNPYTKITGVCETDSSLYLHTINERQSIAVLKK